MTGDKGSRWNRRSFLRIAAAGSGIALAGCQGGDDDGDGGQADTPPPDQNGDGGGGSDGDGDGGGGTTPDQDSGGNGDSMGDTSDDIDMPDPVVLGSSSPVFPVDWYAQFPILEERLEEKYGVGLDANVYGSTVGMTGGFMQGEVQLGYLSPTAITRRRNEGLPIVSPITKVHQYYHALVVDPSIDDWSDIEGKEVAVHSPLSAAAVLTEAMVAEELGSADAVTYQNIIGTTNRMAALEAGEVDVIIAFLSGAIQTEVDGYGKVFTSPYEYDFLTDYPVNCWLAPEPTIDEEEDMYRALVREMQESKTQVYEEDTEDLVDRALATDLNYPEFPRETWIRALDMAKENDMWPADYETNMSVDRMERAIQSHIDLGLLEEDERISAEEILDDRFVGDL